MPHITIEYSSNLADVHDVAALVADVHAVAAVHPWVPLDGLRPRAMVREHYLVSDGAPANAFVAMTVRVGPGRTDDEKQAFLDTILDGAIASVEGPDGSTTSLAIAWSIEVQEIDARWRVNRNRIRLPGDAPDVSRDTASPDARNAAAQDAASGGLT